MSDSQITSVRLSGQITSQTSVESAVESKGSFNGRDVQVENQPSLSEQVSNALEEAGALASEEIEKDNNRREVDSERNSDGFERLLKAAKLQKLLKSLGDLDKNKLKDSVDKLLQQKFSNQGQLRERARQEFKEPAHQFALLKAYKEALVQKGASPGEMSIADEALAQLEKESGGAIRAAENIGEFVKEYSEKGLSEHQSLRDGYRNNIQDYKDLSAVLSDLTQRFGDKKLEQAIQFMAQALGADLAAANSSIDPTKLGLIIADMKRLKSLMTIYKNCGLLADRAKKKGASSSLTGSAIIKHIVSLLGASAVNPAQIEAMLDEFGL